MGKIDIKNIKRLKLLSELMDSKKRLESKKSETSYLKKVAFAEKKFTLSRKLRDQEKSLDIEITCIDYRICVLKSD